MLEIKIQAPGMNALDLATMAQLELQVRAAGDTPLLLTGEGRAFSAGLNLKEVLSLDLAGMGSFLDRLIGLSRALFEHPAPVVAAVNGHAIAGGCILALAADHRVGTTHPRARLGLNEVALGVLFPPAILAMVCHQLPAHTRDEVLLGAGLHGPEDSLRLGLVQELHEDPVARAQQRLAQLADLPRQAYALTKAATRRGVFDVAPEVDAAYRAEQLPVWLSEGVRGRMRAVVGG